MFNASWSAHIHGSILWQTCNLPRPLFNTAFLVRFVTFGKGILTIHVESSTQPKVLYPAHDYAMINNCIGYVHIYTNVFHPRLDGKILCD